MYFHEPKASENAAYECNIQPFFTFTSGIMYLLPTFTTIIAPCDIVHLLLQWAFQRSGVKSSNSATLCMT